jgi:hypothetical protein
MTFPAQARTNLPTLFHHPRHGCLAGLPEVD